MVQMAGTRAEMRCCDVCGVCGGLGCGFGAEETARWDGPRERAN